MEMGSLRFLFVSLNLVEVFLRQNPENIQVKLTRPTWRGKLAIIHEDAVNSRTEECSGRSPWLAMVIYQNEGPLAAERSYMKR